MSKAKCDIRIGTSGWHYAHWEGLFYPEKLPKSKWFEHYAKDFDTVEINNTFYQLPKKQTFELWHKQAPKNFLYTVKANRYITHLKRLKEPKEPLGRFFERVQLLKTNLGPILYQLPPSFHKDLDRLEGFLQALPKGRQAIFEFRHKSWFSDDTYELLDRFSTGFCVHDMAGVPAPRVVTGDIIYVRFHGATGKYQGNYTKAVLKNWAKWLKENTKKVRSIYAYFNNDVHGYAIYNAKTLKEEFGTS
jgi:uncharacterized protein YecE (DUF72 family)